MDALSPVSPEEVSKMLSSLQPKSSPMDYVPTSLLKSCSDIFSIIISNLANLSFAEGHFPNMFKTAEVRPLLKKAGTDDSNFSNYRPISNLNTISKLIERLYLSRIQSHVSLAPSSNMHQSAYKKQHSTETAILKILNDVGQNADTKRATLLIGLDLSAAFDTINHPLQTAPAELWSSRPGFELGYFVPGGTKSIHQVRGLMFRPYPCYWWRPAGFSTGSITFQSLHFTCGRCYRFVWNVSSSVRRRHSAVHRDIVVR